MNAKLLLPVCVLLPLAAGPASPAGQQRDEIVFEGTPDGVPILKLVQTAHEVTGEPFFFDRKDVENENVFFTGRVVVPRERFLPFFDLCLREQDFVHLEQVVAGVTSRTIRKLGQQTRSQQALKTMARCVTLDELARMADRYTLVTTTYVTNHIPAREAVTTLQLYFADSATESIRNVEGTNSILMTGFAANVAQLVGMLARLDESATESEVFVSQRDLAKRVAVLEQQVARLQQEAGKPSGR